jgi:hypothetical protein
MAEEASSAASDVTAIVSGVEQLVDRFVTGLETRIGQFRTIGSELDALQTSSRRAGRVLPRWSCRSSSSLPSQP